MKKETETIDGYEQAVRNINGLHKSRMNRGITQRELSQLSGVSRRQISEYERGASLPSVKNYNKLAKVFKWVAISKTSSRSIRKSNISNILDDLRKLEPVKLPEAVKFTFEEGHCYSIADRCITDREENKNREAVADYVFRYERKQGIHHMFREVRGKWTRTYTDAQLIGKKIIEEVNDV